MTIKTTGQLCISEIQAEFGGAAPYCLSEYYRGGAEVPNTWINRNVPNSGQICIDDFYGASNDGVTVTRNRTSVDEDTTGTNVNTITFTANNFNVANANFTIQGVGSMPITFEDFTTISLNGGTATNITAAGDLSGTLPLTNGSGTITLTTEEDFTLEGAETFTVTITDGTLTATSDTTTINDTSFASITVTDDQTDNLIGQGQDVCFNISALGLPDGLYRYTLTPSTGTLSYGSMTITDDQADDEILANETVCFTVNAQGLPDGAYPYTITPVTGALTYQPVLTDTVVMTASGTFTPAADAAYYHILVVGGGAGGSASISTGPSGGIRGGGAGGHTILTANTALAGNYTVTIGAGGAGAHTTGGLVHGSAGGTTSITGTGVNLSATGGVGVGSNLGGSGSGGNINRTGGSGNTGNSNAFGGATGITTTTPDAYNTYSGAGGTFTPRFTSNPYGGAGGNYGGGGGGVYNDNHQGGPFATGGAGAQGVVVFFKYS